MLVWGKVKLCSQQSEVYYKLVIVFLLSCFQFFSGSKGGMDLDQL